MSRFRGMAHWNLPNIGPFLAINGLKWLVCEQIIHQWICLSEINILFCRGCVLFPTVQREIQKIRFQTENHKWAEKFWNLNFSLKAIDSRYAYYYFALSPRSWIDWYQTRHHYCHIEKRVMYNVLDYENVFFEFPAKLLEIAHIFRTIKCLSHHDKSIGVYLFTN